MSNKIPYQPPKFKITSFNCPFCNAFANQIWNIAHNGFGAQNNVNDTFFCFCGHCGRYSIWYEGKMIYPDFSGVEMPNDDLSDEIKADYQEAGAILQKSPRGAAALLRLAIQKLCNQLGKNGDIDKMIGELVKDGLPVGVQKALDSVRVVGNEAVHPGELDLKDDIETAQKLFGLVNFITEKMITEPKEVEGFFEKKVPESKKKGIEKRDAS